MGQSIESRDRYVLVVEDEVIIRLSAMDLVEAQGFQVLEAASADEAIAILERRSDIHIVFTDIQMAGSMDGLQLAGYTRDRWPPIRFIIVSGGRLPQADAMPEGARFFSKPYDANVVGHALRELAL